MSKKRHIKKRHTDGLQYNVIKATHFHVRQKGRIGMVHLHALAKVLDALRDQLIKLHHTLLCGEISVRTCDGGDIESTLPTHS